jgi:phosphoserine phosphatase
VFDMDGTLLAGTTACLQVAAALDGTADLVELGRGFDEVVASRFPPLPFTGPLDPAGILDPADKVRIVEDLCARYRVDPSRCVAYGDSMSDAPLFGWLNATVAVNADDHLAELAVVDYRGDHLGEAYALGRALLSH